MECIDKMSAKSNSRFRYDKGGEETWAGWVDHKHGEGHVFGGLGMVDRSCQRA